jgi:predicted porin
LRRWKAKPFQLQSLYYSPVTLNPSTNVTLKHIHLHMLASAAALAVIPAAAVAQTASPSVVLYGAVDLNVNRFTAGSRAGGSSVTRLTDGTAMGRRPSRFGIRVDEDLGGGLKAGVQLENGFNADTGTLGQGGLLWGRQAFIFLADSKRGEVRFGRQYIESDISVLPVGVPFGNTLATKASVLVTGAGFALPVVLDIAARANNTVEYRTPVVGGFSGVIQVAPGEGTADRFHGVSGVYASSTLSAAVSYEWNKDRVTGDDTNKVTTMAASYNFGAFKLMGALQQGRSLTNTSGNGTAANVNFAVPATSAGPQFVATRIDARIAGVEVPMGNITVGASVIETSYKGDAGQSTDYRRFGVAANYDLSKRTSLYSAITFAGGDLKDYILERRVMQVGIKHTF